MIAQNEGKFKGSLLEELLNQLIERLVEEGYLNASRTAATARLTTAGSISWTR